MRHRSSSVCLCSQGLRKYKWRARRRLDLLLVHYELMLGPFTSNGGCSFRRWTRPLSCLPPAAPCCVEYTQILALISEMGCWRYRRDCVSGRKKGKRAKGSNKITQKEVLLQKPVNNESRSVSKRAQQTVDLYENYALLRRGRLSIFRSVEIPQILHCNY